MFRKPNSRYKNLSIRSKLIFMLYAALLPFLIILIGYLYYTMRQGSENTLTAAYLKIARQINISIDFVQQDAEDVATYLCINESVDQALNKKNTYDAILNVFNSGVSKDFFMDIIATKSYMNYIAIYSNNGFEPYCITTDTSVLKQNIYEIMSTDSYKRADLAKGAPIWQKFDKDDRDLFQQNRSSKVVMSKVIRNSMENRNIGYLVLGINSTYLENICHNALETKNGGVMVCRDNYTLIDTGDVPEEIRQAIESGVIREKLTGAVGGKVDCGKYILYYSKADPKRTEVYYIISKDIIHQNMKQSEAVIGVLAAGVIFMLLPVALAFSGSIAKPLHRLTDSMKKFKNGDFGQHVEYQAENEIGELTAGYNDMVKNIRELIDTTYILKLKERESELSTLQAQINPHFLYNTLDSIYWKALADGNGDTAEMVYSLSRIFRLSLNRGQGMTTVEKEVELVDNYLSIQKKRFGDQLSYSINAEEDVMNCIIPKLILQPFVENAIVHGIEQEGVEGHVRVTARREKEDGLYFCIEDNGRGMTKEQTEKIFFMDETEVNTSKTPGGYAASNVYERLKLRYKEEFSLQIDSEESKGTKIIMIIPAHIFLQDDIQ